MSALNDTRVDRSIVILCWSLANAFSAMIYDNCNIVNIKEGIDLKVTDFPEPNEFKRS